MQGRLFVNAGRSWARMSVFRSASTFRTHRKTFFCKRGMEIEKRRTDSSSSRDSGCAGIPCRLPRGDAEHMKSAVGPRANSHRTIPHPPGIPASPASLPACGGAKQIAKRKSALKRAWRGFPLDDLRRMRDSNPRTLADQQFSRLPPSTTRPILRMGGQR